MFRKVIIMLISMCVFFAAFSSTLADDTPHFEKCLKWTRVCEKKVGCPEEQQSRYGCYRCIRPGHYGFHIFPTQITRMSCNAKTVDYLRNMGYNCYKQGDKKEATCSPYQKKLVCTSKCIEYAKS